MLGLLAAAAVCGYLAFAFVSECVNPFAMPSSHVARRRYRRGRFAGVVASSVIVALLAWLLVGDALGASISVIAGLLATILLVVASVSKLFRVMSRNRPDSDAPQTVRVSKPERRSPVKVSTSRLTNTPVDIVLDPDPLPANRRSRKRSARPA